MTTEEMIRAAKEAFGTERSDDYKIQPTKHAEELAVTAPALAGLLRSSAISVLAAQFEEKDRLAVQNQARFMTTADRANWAVLLTALFTTLLLIVGPMKSVAGIPNSTVLVVVGVCGVISGGLASMWVYQVREGRRLDAWMSARATAELLRKQYFEGVTTTVLPGDSPIAPALLQLEYFRRYQLNVQIAFYKKRAADHLRGADQLMQIGSFSVALASISAGLAGFLSGRDPAWISIAGLGTFATALTSFATTKDSMNQGRQISDRYTNAADTLALLSARLDSVRTAAAGGETEPLTQFVTAAHDQIMAEHQQWLKATQSIQPAIDKLEDTISKLKKAREGKAESEAAAQP